MEFTGIVSLLIIGATGLLSYRGFRDSGFYASWEFEVEKVLLYRDYKRILTSQFLHVNWQHLIFNMVSLFFFSFNLEQYFGPVRFLILYLLSAAGGNLLSLLIHRKDPAYSSVGASGAINGVIFASIALFPGMRIFFLPGWLFGLIFLLYSVYGIRSGKENIGHESHLGGALTGMVLAILFQPAALQANGLIIALLFIPTAILLWIISSRPGMLMIDNYWYNHQYNYTVDDRYNLEKKSHQQEVDRILEKIHLKGIGSLSRKEREILDEFSRK
jgi:membrane associated rhomboid family serine protease